jgi:predicted dehydrogenase
LKVGVLGVGYWGKKHVEEYLRLGADVVVADPVESSLKACTNKFGVDGTLDYKKILQDDSVHAVSICTPHRTHYPIAKEALLMRKHVLVEKPMTQTAREGDELIEIAQSKNLSLCVGHIFRFNNAVERARELLSSGILGRIYNINLKWTNFEPIWTDRDIIFDLGDHPLDIVMYLTGKTPTLVFCNGDGFRQRNEEVAIINYHIGDIFINVELSWIDPTKRREMMIIGSDKSARIDCLDQKVTVIENSTRSETALDIFPNNTLYDELKHFLDVVKDGRVSEKVSGHIGREIIRLLELARYSLLTKKEVRASY